MTKKDKHSTDPKTVKGKAVSSRNSLTHSLTARRFAWPIKQEYSAWENYA